MENEVSIYRLWTEWDRSCRHCLVVYLWATRASWIWVGQAPAEAVGGRGRAGKLPQMSLAGVELVSSCRCHWQWGCPCQGGHMLPTLCPPPPHVAYGCITSCCEEPTPKCDMTDFLWVWTPVSSPTQDPQPLGLCLGGPVFPLGNPSPMALSHAWGSCHPAGWNLRAAYLCQDCATLSQWDPGPGGPWKAEQFTPGLPAGRWTRVGGLWC